MRSKKQNLSLATRSETVSQAHGFSLIELLVVVSIVTIMTLATVPAFSGLQRASGVTKGAYDLAGTLEQARTYAMSNNTYVFVGIAERDGLNTSIDGVGKLWVAAVFSKDGTRDFGTNNSNLAPLTKLRHFDNMHLDGSNSLPDSGGMTRPSVLNAFKIGTSEASAGRIFSWPLSGSTPTCQFRNIIQFDPRGVASIPPTSPSASVSVPQWLEIGLSEARGNTTITSRNCAALMVEGVTGSVKVYRP